MFWAAALHLVLLAGLVHRVREMSPLEWQVWSAGMLILWPLIVIEGGYRFICRAPGVSRGRAARQWLMVTLAPPLRMGLPSRVRPDLIWLPLAGWRPRDEELPLFLERFFSP